MTAISHATSPLLHELTRAECIELITYGSYLGRIGFSVEGRQLILPTNYLIEGSQVILSTGTGTPMSRLDGIDVAFEVDDTQPLDHGGWSVLVQGTVHLITPPHEVEKLRRGPLHSWAWHAPDVWLAITMSDLSGRRVGPHQ